MSAKRTKGRWVVTSSATGNLSFCRGFSQRDRKLKKNAIGWKLRSHTKRSRSAWELLRNEGISARSVGAIRSEKPIGMIRTNLWQMGVQPFPLSLHLFIFRFQ